MKILTSNYITCAVKACKSSTLSFPLHFQDAELVQEEVDFNAEFIVNILPRIEWDALIVTAAEVCRPMFGLQFGRPYRGRGRAREVPEGKKG